MPALNVELSDEELAAVQAAARGSGAKMRVLAKEAILAKARDRQGRVHALVDEIAERSAGLNQRLA